MANRLRLRVWQRKVWRLLAYCSLIETVRPATACMLYHERQSSTNVLAVSSLFIGLLGVAFPGCSDSITTAATKASADNANRDVDLGKLMQGNELKHTFIVRNTTNKPFTLLAIKKSCGCETTNLSEGTVVLAGASLEVPYSMPGYAAGLRSGRLVLTTDAKAESFKEIVLTLRAEIQAKLWATPAQLQFGTVREGERTEEQTLCIESLVPGLLERFREVTTSRGHVSVELESKTPSALTFRVAFSSDAPVGEVFDLVTLVFDDGNYPQLNVQVRAQGGPVCGHSEGRNPVAFCGRRNTVPASSPNVGTARRVPNTQGRRLRRHYRR